MSSTQRILTTALMLPLSLLAGRPAFLARRLQADEPQFQARRVEADQPRAVRPGEPVQPRAAHAATDPVSLQWKFEKDKPFYQEMTTATRQVVKFMNGLSGQGIYHQEQTLYFSWRPVGRDKDGNWVLKQKVAAVRFAFFEEDGKKIWEYDSRKDPGGVPTLVASYCKVFVGSEFTVTFGTDSKVHKVEGRDELMKELVAYKPAVETFEVQMLGDAALRQAAELLLNPLHAKPVRPGDSWTWNQTLDYRPIGKIESRYRFSYSRPEGKLIRIQVQSALEGKELQGKDKELNGKGNGTILFDRDKGRIVFEELDLPLDGKIDVVHHGLQLIPPRDPKLLVHADALLTQSQKITIKTSDTDPANAAIDSETEGDHAAEQPASAGRRGASCQLSGR